MKYFISSKNKKSLVTSLVFGVLLISSLFAIFTPFATASHATVDIIDDGYAYQTSVQMFVEDPSSNDSVPVTVTSTSIEGEVIDSITLTLPETSSGFFDNIDPTTGAGSLWLMNGDNKFSVGDTINIRFSDPIFYDPLIEESVLFSVVTSGGRSVDLVAPEDNFENGVFETQLKFLPVGFPQPNGIEITEGETFRISPPCAGSANGQIIPVPDGSTVGALRAEVGGTIKATYQDSSHEDTAFIFSAGVGCGGSGGGLVINRVVLDVLGGTSGGDFFPPQITMSKLNLSNLPLVGSILDFILNADSFTPITPLDDPSIDYPLSINGNGYLLTQYANTIETYHGKTGEPVSFKMTLTDATGIEHIALYTNLRGDHREIQDSDTYLIYNQDKPLEITDPNAFFTNVNLAESEYNGKYIAEFNMTFAKPMDTSDVIVRTWDELGNSGDIKMFDAIKIEGEPIVNPDTNNLVVPNSAEIVIPYYKLPYYEIPNPDSDGKLIYYNSFGGLEERQVHPYYNPIIYPDNIGKNERHDDVFYDNIVDEETRAQIVVQTLIGNPFSSLEDHQKVLKFFYPENIGKLDREDEEMQKKIKVAEEINAKKNFSKLYHTG